MYLYIKQHNQTGMKYFGKTLKNPHTYKGSGKYWKRHLKKYGNDVSTIAVYEFDTLEELSTFAIKFSHDNNIVESDQWANLIIENGLDGMPEGFTMKEEQKQKLRSTWTSEKRLEHSLKLKPIRQKRTTTYKHSEEMKQKLSLLRRMRTTQPNAKRCCTL